MMSDSILTRRDAKVMPHLKQYAPVWLENERELEQSDAVVFNVVFQHPSYGWVSRRYRYDSFNDVLYHQGQRALTEAETLALQDSKPYIETAQSNIPNSYGG